MTLRVGLDARLSDWPGIGRYIRNLLVGFAELRDLIEPVVFVNPGQQRGLPSGLEYREVDFSPFSLSGQFAWPSLIRQASVRAFHAPHILVPIMPTAPLVVTIHDMVPFRFKSGSGALAGTRNVMSRLLTRVAARRASRLITDSTFSRREIVDILGLDQASVVAILLGIEDGFVRMSAASRSRALASLGVAEPYLLYVGTNKPWKNLEVALRGVALAASSVEGIQVVIAGKQAQNQVPLQDVIARAAGQIPTTVVGTVTDAELVALYSGTTAVLCPSLYEGFGLTALEALACGAPVIHSGAASLPEVVGQAGIVADPTNPRAWRDAIIALWNDSALRERLSMMGQERSRTFTVARMAGQTLQLYYEVIRTKQP